MGQPIRYADAVRLLGGKGKVIVALDKIMGGLLLGTATAGFGDVLGLIDAKAEAVRLLHELIGPLRDKLAGLNRHSRTECLQAAYATIVMAAFFEALDDVDLPLSLKQLKLTRAEALEISDTEGLKDLQERSEMVFNTLLNARVMTPEIHRPYEDTLSALGGHYRTVAAALGRFMAGLKLWEDLPASTQDRGWVVMLGELPEAASRRYENLYLRLKLDFPEFALWSDSGQHTATRTVIRSGLADLEHKLASITCHRTLDHQLQSIAKANRSPLSLPLHGGADLPRGLNLPSLAEGYVDPHFRVIKPTAETEVSSDSSWTKKPVHSNMSAFLAGFLTSPGATSAPLVVLGQPGAGKSLLARVLAARLPSDQFLPIYIALRRVPLEISLIPDQISYGIRDYTHEKIEWADLSRCAVDAGVLPVLIIDGLDEHIQASGMQRTDYLDRISDFQRREQEQDRAVVVIVTNRTAVAHRCTVPVGTVVMRLEPFNREQINEWLGKWNETNRQYFSDHGLRPFPHKEKLPQEELAGQPLLLLMLALYDADKNALQRESRSLKKTELYRKVLSSFVEREISKRHPAIAADALETKIRETLSLLAVAAFGMINRRRQWITREELNADLATLSGGNPAQSSNAFEQATLADHVIGGFFFICQTEASQDHTALRAYEFLHATFGEFLAAFLLFELLHRLSVRRVDHDLPFGKAFQDGRLYALTSFTILSMHRPVLGYLKEMVSVDDPFGSTLAELIANREARTDRSCAAYRPLPVPTMDRAIRYSANLMILAATSAHEVSVKQFLAIDGDPLDQWQRLCLRWKSALHKEEWIVLLQTSMTRRQNVDIIYSLKWLPESLDSNKPDIMPEALELAEDLLFCKDRHARSVRLLHPLAAGCWSQHDRDCGVRLTT
ncbi:hypothetical protein [Nonomuraea sp. NPDC049709]|uniref:NACHT domain-containing protein n=1 Tax=Nonomuraea sp. NPDC049709 TaxID=3154736 RepID=UPI0034307660